MFKSREETLYFVVVVIGVDPKVTDVTFVYESCPVASHVTHNLHES